MLDLNTTDQDRTGARGEGSGGSSYRIHHETLCPVHRAALQRLFCTGIDWLALIIYEMHVRDLTADPSSGASHPGTYRGLVEHGITGGIEYITSLGVNTVELLPAQEFAAIELPYRDSLGGR